MADRCATADQITARDLRLSVSDVEAHKISRMALQGMGLDSKERCLDRGKVVRTNAGKIQNRSRSCGISPPYKMKQRWDDLMRAPVRENLRQALIA